MMKLHGPKKGMKEAWRLYKEGIVRDNEPDFLADNPFGEEVIVVGANPRRRRSKRRFLMDDNPRRRRRATRRRRRSTFLMDDNPRRRRRTTRRRRIYRDNPVRRRRRYRDNPVGATLGGIDIRRPQTLLMPVVVGLASKMATEKIPGMLNITSALPRYGVQAAVGIGGSLLLKGVVGRTNAAIWAVVSGVTILGDILNRYIFKTALSAIGDSYPQYPALSESTGQVGYVGAYPEEVSGLGAYPYEEVVPY
jgi:hypothetical protein